MSQQEIDRTIAGITRSILKVLLPSLFILIGLQIKAYFDVQVMKKDKLDRIEYMEANASLILLVENKTRATDALAKTNIKDIAHINAAVEKIESYQREVDKLLREKYASRGVTQNLPEY